MEIKEILVIQIKQIGDCILTEPVFRALKEKYLGCRTSFVVSSAFSGIFENNPYIDEVISYNFKKPFAELIKIRKKKYDVVMDFLGNPRSRGLTLFARSPLKLGFTKKGSAFFYTKTVPASSGPEYVSDTKFRMLAALGISASPRPIKIYLTDEEKKMFADYSREKGRAGLVAISATSRRPARRWTKEHFAELADILMRSHGLMPVFVWGPGEEDYVKSVMDMMKEKALMAPPTKLRELASLLYNCKLLVSNDNGVRHLAAAVGTPTLVMTGPTFRECWTPKEKEHRALQADVPCIACSRTECDSMICMKDLRSEEVVKEAADMLAIHKC
ncbi:MAG: glycosyltransferase family 9 protein [Candidatus Omnitrophota bacterium]|nr:glycosyltransferase family 9 protein [Candidatus Omnitrophota bacterium]MBA3066158.1 glycosyltransferase family 9 protein [bacterium]MBU2529262.1 glycosyltransferase family 9 protein [bacterium]MBU3930233.1 glycosyltransferase family 9 protein [bacterium]MBU4122101.1 glycosyltransferase family 9 protein [bacterium]